MRRYPKFLRSSPSFMGLDFFDLGIIGFMLILAVIVNWSAPVTLILSFVLIIITKYLRQKVDLIGLVVPKDRDLILSRRNHDSSI